MRTQKINGFLLFKSFCFIIISFCILFPIFYTLCNSFMSPEEVIQTYDNTLANQSKFSLFPNRISLAAYYEVFLAVPNYLIKFWRSLFMCGIIVIGQVCIGGMCGMAFAKYTFFGKNIWFGMFLLFMMLPIQVTLMPNFLVLDQLNLIGTWAALILPGIFAPFATVLMTLIFSNIPTELIEAAKLDGAGTLKILFKILIPTAKPGVISLLILVFVDNWNMVEQPIVFLRGIHQFPLSVFLASVQSENFSLQFVCGILSLLPVTLLFLFFNEELSKGIVMSKSK